MNQTFDLTDALEQIKTGAKIDDKNGVLAPLIVKLYYKQNLNHILLLKL